MADREKKLKAKARELTLAVADLLRLAGVGSVINQSESGKVVSRSPELFLIQGGELDDEGSEDSET